MAYTGISEKITEKLKTIVNEQELELIIKLLQEEKRFAYEANPINIKKQFQQLLNQYFSMEEDEDDDR